MFRTHLDPGHLIVAQALRTITIIEDNLHKQFGEKVMQQDAEKEGRDMRVAEVES